MRLGVALAGLGAVSTTLVAGVHAANRGLAPTFGALTEHWRVGGRPLWEVAGLVPLDGLRFAAWDVRGLDALESARQAGVLPGSLVDAVAEPLRALRPRVGAFDPELVPRLSASHRLPGDAADHVAALRQDLREIRDELRCERLVVIYAGSTERPSAGLSPAARYGLAAVEEGCPFATIAPCGLPPELEARAAALGVPVAGRDLKTGQTLLKVAVAAALRARVLAVDGWFSLNLLGNLDGEVLADPGARESKAETKGAALHRILDAEASPELYGALQHEVRIEHYRPRGDAKEAWDTIDLRGWMGERMQLKIDLLGRDSILAAPLLLDLARLLDAAARDGRGGVQDWLGFYFKAPAGPPRDPRLDAQLARLLEALGVA